MVHLSPAAQVRTGAALVALVLVTAAAASPAGALDARRAHDAAGARARSDAAASYISPVADGVIVDHFRPPATPYGPGNRGVDWVTPPGSPVVASAAGRVIFAGPVAGALHVTILHPDGLRTSSSYLAAILVVVGDQVEQGQSIGVTGRTFHFGVRDRAGTYLDPEALFAGPGRAHLVPGPDEGAEPLVSGDGWAMALERAALAAVVVAGRQLPAGATGRAAAVAHEALSVSSRSLLDLAVEVERWRDQFDHCTPRAEAVPPPTGRRVAILVGGLGSSSDHAAVDDVDGAALGYAPGDVVRFSYGGGRVPGPPTGGPFDELAGSTYQPADTEGDLRRAADRLAALVAAVTGAAPGVTVDLIAHSQGGVVVRLALAAGLRVSGVVATLGTPHQGADLATAIAAVGPTSPEGRLLGSAVASAGLDLRSASVAQLAETSSVIRELAGPVPADVHLVSIGASGDLTVPDVRTVVPGSAHATVHLTGPHAHDHLPGDPATTRELGLALAGKAPTCPSVAQGLTDLVSSHLIARTEDSLGLVLATQPPSP